MRGGLSAIQQTLTPEASSVLSHSIALACSKNHGQTTPLHVAATLLASPTGFLRQACIKSHPNSSHPLQCRALELCFTVALDRIPAAQHPSGDPPISNALNAALKRAQAHQRKGCPEQQQQPLLAVKVELEQLIISILDDPSVSRVMREAFFSSPAVKAAIEQVLNSQANSGTRIGLGGRFRPGPQPVSLGLGSSRNNLYLNPKLQQQQPQPQNQLNYNNHQRADDVKKVFDIITQLKKRNPVLVGEPEPREIVKEVLSKIDKDETQIHDEVLKGVEVISLENELGLVTGLDKGQLQSKINELSEIIDRKMVLNCKGQNGVIIDLGNLKWVVDQPSNQGVSEGSREAVIEMGKLLRKYGENSKIWFVGTATCETYLRCQIHHPTMENEWDLNVVSIVARPSMSGVLPRLGSGGGILSTSVECLSPMKGFTMPASSLTRRVSENMDPLRRFSCCPQCTEKYGQELAKLEAEELDRSSPEAKSDGNKQSLPPWLQNAKMHADDAVKQLTDSPQSKDQDAVSRQKTQELQKKWSQTCLQLHPSFHHNISTERITPSPLSMTGFCNPILLGRQSFQPKLQQPRILGDSLQLKIGSPAATLVDCDRPRCTPGSPVRTELALGPIKLPEAVQQNVQKDRPKVVELQKTGTPVIPGDIDSFKRLLKGLIEKVAWQTDAASAVASTITQCKSDKLKGDTWLLFSGPDRVGKRKMAVALSELICGSGPIVISLGSRRDGNNESGLNFRGKTAIDRISEAVRRNPNSVILLQDIDEADLLVRGSIKRAMERGRLTDSHGREISLGNIIFIVTSTWTPHQPKGGLPSGDITLNEEKMTSLASGGWELRISIGEKNTGKRSSSWLNDDQERSTKQRKDLCQGLSFDLNCMADNDEDRLDGSNNSSDLTVEHGDEHGHELRGSPTASSTAPIEMLSFVDEAIIFKPVDFAPIRHNIEKTITAKFGSILGENLSTKIETEALEKIMSGIWLGQTTLESWTEKVLTPSIQQLKTTMPSLLSRSHDREISARLELDQASNNRDHGDWLPHKISVATDTQ